MAGKMRRNSNLDGFSVRNGLKEWMSVDRKPAMRFGNGRMFEFRRITRGEEGNINCECCNSINSRKSAEKEGGEFEKERN
jgi:hypothetical protein